MIANYLALEQLVHHLHKTHPCLSQRRWRHHWWSRLNEDFKMASHTQSTSNRRHCERC